MSRHKTTDKIYQIWSNTPTAVCDENIIILCYLAKNHSTLWYDAYLLQEFCNNTIDFNAVTHAYMWYTLDWYDI